jgi:hypothetical protein
MRKKFFIPGVEAKPVGKGDMGELLAQPRRFDIEPDYSDVARGTAPISTLEPLSNKLTLHPREGSEHPVLPGVQPADYPRSFPGFGQPAVGRSRDPGLIETREIVPDQMVIRNVYVGTAVIRIDTTITNRAYILISNKSDRVVWINSVPTVSTAVGYPLAASSPAGSLNGEVFAADIDDTISFYAIAAAGTNMIVVVESTKKPFVGGNR